MSSSSQGPPPRSAEGQGGPQRGGGPPSPCGACKFLRRKCVAGCVFAPHFASEQGAAKFAAVHKVFGASNVSKLLLHLPAARRHDAVVTVCYEAQSRLADPVYGCVATILRLQQEVAMLQAELAVVRAQLISNRIAVANAIQNAQNHHNAGSVGLAQPAYSNTSSASNDLSKYTSINPRLNFVETIATTPPPFPQPPTLSCQFGPQDSEGEDGEESHDPMVAFIDDIFRQKD